MFVLFGAAVFVPALAVLIVVVLRRHRPEIEEMPGGGPYLHWVPDRRGGSRLAGDFLPEPDQEA